MEKGKSGGRGRTGGDKDDGWRGGGGAEEKKQVVTNKNNSEGSPSARPKAVLSGIFNGGGLRD